MARSLAVLAAAVALGATVPAEPERPVDALASVMCAECKRCSPEERAAIGHVAIARATWASSWWGDGLVGVIRSSSCDWDLPPRADGRAWSPGFVAWHHERLAAIAFEADRLLAGEVDNPTPTATHFHTRALGQVWPALVEVAAPQAWFHRFYFDKGLGCR